MGSVRWERESVWENERGRKAGALENPNDSDRVSGVGSHHETPPMLLLLRRQAIGRQWCRRRHHLRHSTRQGTHDRVRRQTDTHTHSRPWNRQRGK